TNTCRKGAGGATAPLLRAAHGRLRLWRRCSDTNCQRERSCCGDADRCGARIAPELAMAAARATGHPRRTAARGGGQGRQPGTPPLSRAKNPALAGRPVLGPCRIRPASQNGSWRHIDQVPLPPPLDPQFERLVASPWVRDARAADVRTDVRGDAKV